MATRDPALELTYDDLERWPDDGKRHESIDGDHYGTPSPMPLLPGLSIPLTEIFPPFP
jgi:hypothetical protein